MRNQIANKVVVITGASSGAGRATAFELAEEKAFLVLASRNEQVLEELAEECRKIGCEVLVAPTDVTDNTAMHRLAVKAFEWKGRIDVWVNNAGVLAAGTFEEMPWEAHQKVINTNLLGYMSGAHAVLPYFKRQGEGILINNISIGAYVSVPYGGAYTASKFALRGFFESLKGELTGWSGIHIVDLFPAFLDTPGIQHAGNYTGKVLKPSPPVYDPRIVAHSVKSSILYPKSTRYPGGASLLFKIGHSLAPEWMSKMTGLLMKGYFKVADPAEKTDGNLFQSVDFSMSTNGNSRPRLTPHGRRMLGLGLAGAAIGLGLYMLSGKRNA
ncbi:SDR family oxidoreductase [Chitinophaga pinensis]|uniref:Short-chain dehydrogenase/reductase SDR n=1 Tax=Chitinophaga pinensis (strain ATCC 43595 / DSM 2588 / LMG 13176 / NBRC 15968 / NCIMB 11800 / UQM 2034) TaxID=485918 RepID=A0A979GQH7_CHIPD|nr:SDR family oxidoreductase [Chitinophaga pinensis]ACU57651.1 short-chain dehydrogenase/reductase SDR [Chitinophaga pinensis DSM 2588]